MSNEKSNDGTQKVVAYMLIIGFIIAMISLIFDFEVGGIIGGAIAGIALLIMIISIIADSDK